MGGKEKMTDKTGQLEKALMELIECIVSKEKENAASGVELEFVPKAAEVLIDLWSYFDS